jgi:hypothetical protein
MFYQYDLQWLYSNNVHDHNNFAFTKILRPKARIGAYTMLNFGSIYYFLYFIHDENVRAITDLKLYGQLPTRQVGYCQSIQNKIKYKFLPSYIRVSNLCIFYLMWKIISSYDERFRMCIWYVRTWHAYLIETRVRMIRLFVWHAYFIIRVSVRYAYHTRIIRVSYVKIYASGTVCW